ncbi:hypothetical protein E5288_WYG009453 [Bos mutus]|uniref:Uncharacterized protein n=1 Tax=Bos mutus TaxID=72004 RepID=A0A6B0SCX3_9CETA|nr:hypothetical protein [Bos mutus]
MQAPSLVATANAEAHSAVPGAPSFLEELLMATSIPDIEAPSLEAAADAGAYPALPGAPSFLDKLLATLGIQT